MSATDQPARPDMGSPGARIHAGKNL